jgi:hypothetical protein
MWPFDGRTGKEKYSMSTIPNTFSVGQSPLRITQEAGLVEVRRTQTWDERHSSTDVWAMTPAELLELWRIIGDELATMTSDPAIERDYVRLYGVMYGAMLTPRE